MGGNPIQKGDKIMDKKVIEINGVKLEVDLTEAKVIENYKVGDPVKVLIKTYSDYQSKPGTIVGFDAFENLPTIIIAYLDISYDKASVKFEYFNAQSKDVEICKMNNAEVPFAKERVNELMDLQIVRKEEELADLKRKKEFFEAEFGAYFKNQVKESV